MHFVLVPVGIGWKRKSEQADKICDFVEGNYLLRFSFQHRYCKCKENAFIQCDYNKNNVRSAHYWKICSIAAFNKGKEERFSFDFNVVLNGEQYIDMNHKNKMAGRLLKASVKKWQVISNDLRRTPTLSFTPTHIWMRTHAQQEGWMSYIWLKYTLL